MSCRKRKHFPFILSFGFIICLSVSLVFGGQNFYIPESWQSEVIKSLISRYGQEHAFRIERGVKGVASTWWKEDGSPEEFREFCLNNFIADESQLNDIYFRIEHNFEYIRGYTNRLKQILSWPVSLSYQKVLPVDRFFAGLSFSYDYFKNKLAFFIILNFPHYSVEEKIAHPEKWTRLDWAKARLGDLFVNRIPPEAQRALNKANGKAGEYLRNYFICMDRVLAPGKKIVFPQGLKLNSHHGLRDNLKGQYTKSGGFERQELIYNIMLRIIEQTIPEVVINNPEFYWDPQSNQVYKKKNNKFIQIDFVPEGLKRYQVLHDVFLAKKALDKYYPSTPNAIERTFENRQISEKRVEKLLMSVISSPLTAKVAGLIEKRLGRKLRPFDIWYSGFQAQTKWSEDYLDEIIKKKYPNPISLERDLPNILIRLGFPPFKATFLAKHIGVNPVPMGGFATPPRMRGDKAYIHTRFEKDGLDYKGFRIGMHELGHGVEQVTSFYFNDYYFLSGVPMSAFTEAVAELFAYRNTIALGLEKGGDPKQFLERALAAFWYVYEMGGEAILEMKVWRWMYDHPGFSTADLKNAVITLAREIWNDYYAKNFHEEDSPILAIYSHMISGSFYLHSYPLGNIIMFQLDNYLRNKDFAAELERILRLGRLTPDLWMKSAVGEAISTEPLLKEVEEALARLDQ